MTLPSIETAREADRDTVIKIITFGFSADPMTRWMWPRIGDYLANMPAFVAAFGGAAFEHGTAWYADGYRAAALWLPPGAAPDVEALGAMLESKIRPEIMEDIVALQARMAEYHPHDEPCWYLPLIAADPLWMGKGLGSALMKHALQHCDESGQMAYLESSNPRNISLYERHGFEVTGKVQAGSSPVVHPMIRRPSG